MHRIIFIAALAATSAAFAQTDRNAGTQAFVNMCVARASPSVTTPEPTCACGAGVYSGFMTDRQYEIMRRVAPFTGDQPAMSATVQQMIAEGYTADEIRVTGQLLIDRAPDVHRTCAGLER